MIQQKAAENSLQGEETRGALYLNFYPLVGFCFVFFLLVKEAGAGRCWHLWHGHVGSSHPSPLSLCTATGYSANQDFPAQLQALELPPGRNEHNIYPFPTQLRGPRQHFGAALFPIFWKKNKKEKRKKKIKKEGKKTPPELAARGVLMEMLQTWLPLTSPT